MEKYILIGVPGCGKTTLGEEVAKKLELPFFDTDRMTIESLDLDDEIEMLRYNTKVRFHYGQVGVVKQLEEYVGPAIIATGAEVALMPECAPLLKEMGTVIYLERSIEDILEEVKEREQSFKHIVIQISDDGIKVTSAGIESVKLYAKEISQYRDLADEIFNNDVGKDMGVNQLTSLIRRLMKVGKNMKEGGLGGN